MKINQLTPVFQLLLIGMFVFLSNSCEKPVSPDVLPVLTTTEVTFITEATALSGGYISSDAGNEITSRGVCWSTKPNPTITDSITIDAAGTGRFTSKVMGLIPYTTYYLRAYATNKKGTSYGLQETFTTKSLGITTKEISDTTINSAKSGGVINIDGDSTNIIERGICWNTQPNPTILHFKTINGNGKGEFNSEMTLLSHNTVYYVRAYIINSSGTYYGNQISFKTKDGVIKLYTEEATSITALSATVKGYIQEEGGTPVTERGFCVSKSPNPTTENKIANTSNFSTFTTNFTGLIHNITYYVRSYAINSIGTFYGNEIIFNTLDGVIKLTTNNVTGITPSWANSGGTITSDGGAEITARGVVWNISQNPTVNLSTKTNNGTGIGSFTSSILGLHPATIYYVRAYATNSLGTTYGNELSFESTSYGTFTDSRDGNSYKWILIGNQVWMAENLKYLPSVVGPATGSLTTSYYYVYDYDGTDVNEAKAKSNYDTYGVLYNWTAAMNGAASSITNPSGVKGVCPTGWHLPSHAEWTELINYLGGPIVAGGKLKEIGSEHWWATPNIDATNETGFTALPGGFCNGNGSFYNIGFTGYWWSASEDNAGIAWSRGMNSYDRSAYSGSYVKDFGFCVRCVRD